MMAETSPVTPSRALPAVLGVDVGGTNTDAVVLGRRGGQIQVLASAKEPTTTDVTSGVKKALLACLMEVTRGDGSVQPVQIHIDNLPRQICFNVSHYINNRLTRCNVIHRNRSVAANYLKIFQLRQTCFDVSHHISSGDRNRSVAAEISKGTTQLMNALAEGSCHLAKVAVLRICGATTEEIPFFSDFPVHLERVVAGPSHLIRGGYRYDGVEAEPFDEGQLREVIRGIKAEGMVKNFVILGVFSKLNADQEVHAREILKEEYPEASVTLSYELGHLGLVERENAAVLNECLKPVCKHTVERLHEALYQIGLAEIPVCLTQNDGTLMDTTQLMDFPLLTFASGATNSVCGAAFLSGLQEAIVIDIGGTTTDVGVLEEGRPRRLYSSFCIGEARFQIPMPDIISVCLGGGSYISQQNEHLADGVVRTGVQVGPLSTGSNLLKESLVFGNGSVEDTEKRILTATDIAVAAGLCHLGCVERVSDLKQELVSEVVEKIHSTLEELIEDIKASDKNLPVVIVGGGSVLIDAGRRMRGTSRVVIPPHAHLASAVGAAMAHVSATFQGIVSLGNMDTHQGEQCSSTAGDVVKPLDFQSEQLIQNNRHQMKPNLQGTSKSSAVDKVCSGLVERLVNRGVDEDSIQVRERQESLRNSAMEINVRVAGDLAALTTGEVSTNNQRLPWVSPCHAGEILRQVTDIHKQLYTMTGEPLFTQDPANEGDNAKERDFTKSPQEPYIDNTTGEWILSPWDVECIMIGAGIYGCGGGGSGNIGRLRALSALHSGKRMRVVSPQRIASCDTTSGAKSKLVVVPAFIGSPVNSVEQGESSNETSCAFRCLKDVCDKSVCEEGRLVYGGDAVVETTSSGVKIIRNYLPRLQSPGESNCKERKQETVPGGWEIVGLMPGEMAAANCIEPLVLAARLGLPVVDADELGRAFPELQMFLPYIYGSPPFPVAVAGSGSQPECTVLLHSPDNKAKLVENFLRDFSVGNGSYAGLCLSLTLDDMMSKTPHHSISRAWRLGDAILRARLDDTSPVKAIEELEDAQVVVEGRVAAIQLTPMKGFNRGHFIVAGRSRWENQEVLVEFQNENLIVAPLLKPNEKPKGHDTEEEEEGSSAERERGPVLGCTPDLICVVDVNTGQAITNEEMKRGMRVAVLLMPCEDLFRTAHALSYVGPQAFKYDVNFQPFRRRRPSVPVPPTA